MNMQQFSKKATVVSKDKKYANPEAPASFPMKKLLSVIFKHQGLVFDWEAKITMAQAGEIIDKEAPKLPPRQPKQSYNPYIR